MQLSRVNICPLILICVLFLLESYGKALTHKDSSTNILRRQSSENFKLVILPEKNVFPLQGPVRLAVINKNDGLEDVGVSSVYPEYDYDVTVEDPQGRKIPLSDGGEKLKNPSVILRRSSMALKPGDVMSEDICLNELFDLSEQGEYKITISRSYCVIGSNHCGKAISNQVIIKVGEMGVLATDQKQSQDNFVTDSQYLKLSLMPEKDIFDLSSLYGMLAIPADWEAVGINVICKNDSPWDSILPIAFSPNDYDVEVRDSHGDVIPLSNEGRKIKSHSEPTHRYAILKPGEEMIEEINLADLFNLSVGEYQVIAGRRFYQENDRWTYGDYAPVKTISNPITIRVR